jgi:hypothetical protein
MLELNQHIRHQQGKAVDLEEELGREEGGREEGLILVRRSCSGIKLMIKIGLLML